MSDNNTSLRAQSRRNWGRKQIDGIPTDEQLMAGSLMRLADSLEKDESISDVRDLARVGRRFLQMRQRQPRHKDFQFRLYLPKEKVYFSITIFGFTISIHKSWEQNQPEYYLCLSPHFWFTWCVFRCSDARSLKFYQPVTLWRQNIRKVEWALKSTQNLHSWPSAVTSRHEPNVPTIQKNTLTASECLSIMGKSLPL